MSLFPRFLSSVCRYSTQKCRQGSIRRGKSSTNCMPGPSGCYPGPSGGYKIWKNVFLFVCMPIVAAAGFNTFGAAHEEKPRAPFVEYEYMYLRSKKFPWKDGIKSAFHNPNLNPLPGIGYEDGNNPEVPKPSVIQEDEESE